MRKHAFAEWLLSLFTDDARATAVMGDLAETSAEKGSAWFWRAYAGVLASFAWRPAVAFAFVGVVTWFGGRYYRGSGGFYCLISGNAPSSLLGRLTMLVVNSAGEFSAFIFLFAAVRFGLNDRLTRLALGFAVLGSVVSWFYFAEYMSAVTAATVTVLCVHSFMSPKGRRSLMAIVFLWIAFTALEYVGLKIFRAGIDHVLGFRSAPAAYEVWFYSCYLAALAIACWLCARVHRAVIGSRALVRG